VSASKAVKNQGASPHSDHLPITWHGATLFCGEESTGLQESRFRFQKLLGLPEHQYCDLPRAVLCPSWSWTKKEARRQAFRLVEAPAAWRSIVLLGSKTKTAFGYTRPFFSHEDSSLNPDVQLVCLPSPMDRAWCDVRLVQRARQILREVIPSLPWGSQHDPFTALSFSLRCAAECTSWARALPTDLRAKAPWDEDDFMVALDAVEEYGVDRERGEYIARVSGKGAAA